MGARSWAVCHGFEAQRIGKEALHPHSGIAVGLREGRQAAESGANALAVVLDERPRILNVVMPVTARHRTTYMAQEASDLLLSHAVLRQLRREEVSQVVERRPVRAFQSTDD